MWYQKELHLGEKLGNWTATTTTLHNVWHVALEVGSLDNARGYFVRSRDLYTGLGLDDFAAEEETLIQILQHCRVDHG